MDVTEYLEGLYGLPLDEFTAARDGLAAELRARGEREAAGEVKTLRRPTLPAWTVNQLVRQHPGELQELLSLRADLRAAQQAAISGGRVEDLREIGERRRRVIDELLDRAETVLTQGGHATSRATLDRVRDTLMAATLDEEAARAVEGGRLARELTPPSGFDSLTEEVPAPAKSAPARDRKARERARRAAEEARAAKEAADRADREAGRLEQEAERSRKEATRARRNADRAAARALDLRRKAEELEQGLQA